MNGVSPEADERAKAKAARARANYDADYNPEDDEDQSDLEEYIEEEESEYEAPDPKPEREDIFTYCNQLAINKSIPIEYVIRREGKRIAEKPHPYSWSEVRAEYGGGNYKISARNAVSGLWIRHQIEPIGEDLTKKKEEEDNGGNGQTPNMEPPTPVTPPEAPDQFMRMMGMMKEQEREARTDADRRMEMQVSMFKSMMESQASQNQAMMTAIVTAVGGKAPEGDNGPMKTVVELLNGQNTTLQNTVNQLYTMIIDKGQTKNEAGKYQDPMALLDLVRESEDRGFTRMKTMLDLSDAKVKEQVLLMGGSPKSDEDEGDKPIYQQLIEAVLPGVKQALAPGEAAPVQPAQPLPVRPSVQPRQPAAPGTQNVNTRTAAPGGRAPQPFRGQAPTKPYAGQVPANARPVPASVQPAQAANPNAAASVKGTTGASTQPANAQTQAQASGQVGEARGKSRGNLEKVNDEMMGLPSIGKKKSVSETKPEPEVQPTGERAMESKVEAGPIIMPETPTSEIPLVSITPERVQEIQVQLITIISKPLRGWLLKQSPTAECAANTLTAVQNAGVSYPELFAAFPQSSILMDIAHRLGVPKAADPWLNRYYADLRNHAAHELRRHTKS
jgi:hypothetical protein